MTRPWPGRLPPPSPAVVLARAAACQVIDAAGVRLSSLPGSFFLLRLLGSPWRGALSRGHRVGGTMAADDRWWSTTHRRRARVQVVTASGSAQLLVAESGGWWLEGVYD